LTLLARANLFDAILVSVLAVGGVNFRAKGRGVGKGDVFSVLKEIAVNPPEE
jgi:hypothetical protein